MTPRGRVCQHGPMNKNQLKGAAKTTAGKVQRATGKLLGSTKQEARGALREAAGKVQKERGNLEQRVRAVKRRNRG